MSTYAYIRLHPNNPITLEVFKQKLKGEHVSERNILVDEGDKRYYYKLMISRLQAGDLVIVDSLGSFGETDREILDMWNELRNKRHVNIKVTSLPMLDTRKRGSEVPDEFIADIAIGIYAGISEEVLRMRRLKYEKSIVKAKARGNRIGSVEKGLSPEFEKYRQLYLDGKIQGTEAAAILGMSKNSFYYRIKHSRMINYNDRKKLQNGSDIRGVACEGVKGEDVNLTLEVCMAIGVAFAKQVAEKTGVPVADVVVAIGRDSRVTGRMLTEAMIRGITSAGARVIDCGMASTPAMFMALVYEETKATASCMMTASHLPYNRNGMKFFTVEGGYEKMDVTTLLERASKIDPAKIPETNDALVTKFDLIGRYSENLCALIREGVKAADDEKPLEGLRIVVDAGNGAGGFFAEKVLAVLGADITGSQFLEPDGMFPNHAPNPEDEGAMRSISDATLRSFADLGLIFDTDVDRMSAVFSDGREVNRDAVIALMAAIVAKDHPRGTIITDSVTSDRLTEFLEKELRMKHLCYMRGYKNIINKCKELNAAGIDSPLAMETSGHGCLPENHYLDDGAYLAVKLVIALAKAKRENREIADLIAGLSKEYSAAEKRFPIMAEDFAAYGQEVMETFERAVAADGHLLPDSYEGVRVRFKAGALGRDFAGGWLLLRASLHDPVMVLNTEGKTEEDRALIDAYVEEKLVFATSLKKDPA